MQAGVEFLHFCGHHDLKKGFLSNWFASPFELDGIKFVCVEQAMMYYKAKLMGDENVAGQVLMTSDPKTIKGLGRDVRPWNQKLWDREKVPIVTRCLLAKFEQNPELQAQLLVTGDKTLVEAAHYDKIWGNGLSANHPDANDPSKWPGLNLLGQCLMEVRKQLQKQ